MASKDTISLKERVKILMETNPYCKDNDFSLCSEIWNQDCEKLGLVLSEISATTFISLMSTGDITKQQTIQRIRRDLNFKQPDTIGASYKSNLKKKLQINSNFRTIEQNEAIKKKTSKVKSAHLVGGFTNSVVGGFTIPDRPKKWKNFRPKRGDVF